MMHARSYCKKFGICDFSFLRTLCNFSSHKCPGNIDRLINHRDNRDLFVSICCHDYFFKDPFGRDEEIGGTVVDLEDRVFCSDWKTRHPVPVERRTLRAGGVATHLSRGKIEMYV